MKKFNENVLRSRYEKYGEETIDFLINTYNAVKESNINTNDYYYCVFDLLATQLYLYFSSKNQLLQETKLTTTDAYARTAKSPLVGLLNRCHANIIDIMQKLSLSPFEQAKLKRLSKEDDDESANDLINKLINE